MNTLYSSPVLEIGDQFPRATVQSCDGAAIRLSHWPQLVLFYRGHWCRHCREQLRELSRYASSFRAAGAGITAISADADVDCLAMQQSLGGALLICHDPDARLTRELGLADRDDAVPHVISRPAAFVVDAEGIVRYRYVSRSPADRPMPNLLLLAFESLGRWSS